MVFGSSTFSKSSLPSKACAAISNTGSFSPPSFSKYAGTDKYLVFPEYPVIASPLSPFFSTSSNKNIFLVRLLLAEIPFLYRFRFASLPNHKMIALYLFLSLPLHAKPPINYSSVSSSNVFPYSGRKSAIKHLNSGSSSAISSTFFLVDIAAVENS